MATYERSTRIRAPLSRVWEFHSTVEGLRGVTPPWLHLRVEHVVGPDGARDPAVLEPGTKLRLSVQPFGVGPRQRWVSEITDRREGDGWASFTDVMREGPFRQWRHTHRFFGDGEDTILRDRVEYGRPYGLPLGRLTEVVLDRLFAYRHRETRAALEY